MSHKSLKHDDIEGARGDRELRRPLPGPQRRGSSLGGDAHVSQPILFRLVVLSYEIVYQVNKFEYFHKSCTL